MANSFYGNIINAPVKPQFYFDKIYGSKYSLRSNEKTDGIYIGRYALVEYDYDPLKDLIDVSGKSDEEILKLTTIGDISIVYTRTEEDLISIKKVNKNKTEIIEIKSYYEGKSNEAGHQPLDTEKIKKQNFDVNYWIDRTLETDNWGADEIYLYRGWDSTVWQKIYISPELISEKDPAVMSLYNDKKEVYVQIAELNAAVPEMSLIIDAPSAEPEEGKQYPYIDKDSIERHYKVRVKPTWDIKIAKAVDGEKSDEFNENQEPLNIYYNKKAFEPQTPSYHDNSLDRIQITDISSGTNYSRGKNDIKAVSINLPSIGNAICSIWDMLYGTEVTNDISGQPIRANYGWWNKFLKDGEWQGNKDKDFQFNVEDFKSLSGTIKILYQMLGNKVIDNNIYNSTDVYDIKPQDISENQIYYLSKEAPNIVGYYYLIHSAEIVPPPVGTYINESQTERFPVVLDDRPIYVKDNKGHTEYPNGSRVNPYILHSDQWPQEIVVGYLVEGYRWKHFIDFDNPNNAPFFNSLLKLNQITNFDDYYTRDPKTVQGLINLMRDIFIKFNLDELEPGKTLVVDKTGHIALSEGISSPEIFLTYKPFTSIDEVINIK